MRLKDWQFYDPNLILYNNIYIYVHIWEDDTHTTFCTTNDALNKIVINLVRECLGHNIGTSFKLKVNADCIDFS